MTHLLSEVDMKALGCVIKVHRRVEENHVKQALVPLTEQLDLDDVGYFYDPKNPDFLCTVPGQLHGVMSNTVTSYFALGDAVKKAVSVLNSLDEDYNKLLIIVADKVKDTDQYNITESFKTSKDIIVHFHLIKEDHPKWLEELCKEYQNVTLYWSTDVEMLYDVFKDFSTED